MRATRPSRFFSYNKVINSFLLIPQLIGTQKLFGKKITKTKISCHSSSKIREEDYRQIQTNVPFLAPEILAVFANSQIFHDNQPNKSLAIVHKSPAIIDEKKSMRDTDSEKKLLKRLEGNSFILNK